MDALYAHLHMIQMDNHITFITFWFINYDYNIHFLIPMLLLYTVMYTSLIADMMRAVKNEVVSLKQDITFPYK